MNKISKINFFVTLFSIFYFLFSQQTFAATNINPLNKWAWNDVIGWIDLYSTDSVMVRGNKIDGYAASSVGYISFDCATGPVGSNCLMPYGVANDFSGNLSGWAWSENIGWISFNCADQGVCGVSNYKVTINTFNGQFNGWAWNDVVGWISFNCANVAGSCSFSDYKSQTNAGNNPETGELFSSVFDSGSIDGAVLNSLMWKGSLNNGVVQFQIASSPNVGGPWNFTGPDETPISFYQPNPDIFVKINGHVNRRYFRYKIILKTDNWQQFSPKVDDVIINYSL